MKQLLLIALSLPLGLSAMDEGPTFPAYTENLTPHNYQNSETFHPYDHATNCHLDAIFNYADKLDWSHIMRIAVLQRNFYPLLQCARQAESGNTLLHQLVIRNGNPETVAYLLQLSFDPAQKNEDDKTALELAQELNNQGMIEVLAGQTIDRMASEISNSIDEPDNFIPAKNKDDWSSYLSFRNSIIGALVVTAGTYAWHRYHENKTGA